MKEYTTSNPAFSESIEIVETTDPAHADNINKASKQIFENTLMLKKQVDGNKQILDLSDAAYDRDTYYPVTGSPIPEDGMHLIKVYAHLGSGAVPPWATNAQGFESGLEILDSKNGYGICLNSYALYVNGNTNPAGYLQMRASGTPVITLRGGGKYFVYTDFVSEWTVQKDKYELDGDIVRPIGTRTLRLEKAVIMANLSGDVTGNAASADRWAAPRYLEGAAVDGTANRHHFGVCSTAGGSAAKACSIAGLEVVDGARANVQFANANTADNPTLNINGAGAAPIYWRGKALPGRYIYAGAIMELQYVPSGGAGAWHVVGDPTQVQVDNLRADVEGIQVGGRNLLTGTNRVVTNNDYLMWSYRPGEYLADGETYTISLCVKPAANITYFAPYLSYGSVIQAALYPNGTDKQVLSKTFTARYAAGKTPDKDPLNGNINMYRFPNDGTVTDSSTIYWVKIERGNKATDWTPAPEDKADAGHNHDDAYYTEAEIDTKLADVNTNLANRKEYYSQMIDLSDTSIYDEDTWYPVRGTGIAQTGMSYIKVTSGFGIAKPSWSTHDSGNYTCNMEIHDMGSGWGATVRNGYCTDYSCRYTAENPVGYQQMTNSSTPVLFLRGGGKYAVYTDFYSVWTVCTDTYTDRDQSVAPVSDCPGISLNKTTIHANLEGNVTGILEGKFATPRCIGGVPFDASGDIHHYAVCLTEPATAAKTASLAGFKLVAGATVTVDFSRGNTAENPTLNVNGTGAADIRYHGAPIPADHIIAGTWMMLVYNGSYWYVVGGPAQSQINALKTQIAELEEQVSNLMSYRQISFNITDGYYWEVSSGELIKVSNAYMECVELPVKQGYIYKIRCNAKGPQGVPVTSTTIVGAKKVNDTVQINPNGWTSSYNGDGYYYCEVTEGTELLLINHCLNNNESSVIEIYKKAST